MSEDIITRPGRSRRGGRLAVWTVLLIIGLALAAVFLRPPRIISSPASIIEAPIRAASPAGDRVLLLTSQWKTFRNPTRRATGSYYTDLYIDVWAFSANDAKPLWRTRLESERRGVNMGRKLIGVHDGVLWIVSGKGLQGLSIDTGAVVADAARIEAKNPQLSGLTPREDRYIRFDNGGLGFTAADGKAWRLDSHTLAARPDAAEPSQPAPGVFRVARISGGNSTWAFMERGITTSNRWIGLLAEKEVEGFRTRGGIGGIDPQTHPLYRLWAAKMGSKDTFFGPRPVYSDFAPLPESPEFLQSGLLSDNNLRNMPILLFKPDSLLVLHRDRLGEAGTWRLSRISGPRGKVLWTRDLPQQRLDAVMPGETTVVLLGTREERSLLARRNERRNETVPQLTSIDLKTGEASTYGFHIPATKPQDIPPSSTR